ncbi:ionotropic receptor 21a-like [Hyalella azteca]|nr:ionotropic receptor 21a-like [Hyalella azteca]
MREEENAVGMLYNASAWHVYVRQLYTSSGGPLIKKSLTWKPGTPIENQEEIYPEQMKNFYGEKFHISTLDFRPFTDFIRQPNTRVVKEAPSLDIYILREVARHLNFTYDIVTPMDDLWGTRLENGSWTGVVGDVQFRRSNFSLVLSLTMERRLILDFTRMYYTDPLTFVTAKNRPLPQWQKVFEPFANNVWLLWGTTLGTCSVLYHGLRKLNPLIGQRATFSQSCLDIFGSFLSQNLQRIPSKTMTQVFIATWLIYGLLTTTYYKSALMAVLAVPTTPPTLNTLQELYDSKIQYGMIDAKGSEYQLFSTSKIDLYQKLFQKMSFYSSKESMRRVAEGSYAYIYFRANIESIVMSEYTDRAGQTYMHIAAENFFPGGYAWAFPKGAPYMRTIDQLMQRCLQAGLVSRWVLQLNKLYAKEKHENSSTDDVLRPIDDGLVVLQMSHLQGPFILLVMGLVLGLTSFIVEMASCKRQKLLEKKPVTSYRK